MAVAHTDYFAPTLNQNDCSNSQGDRRQRRSALKSFQKPVCDPGVWGFLQAGYKIDNTEIG